MTTSYEVPGTQVEIKRQISDEVRPADTSITAFIGVAERGPVAVPTLVSSRAEFEALFGSYMASSDLAYMVKNFFDAGGRQCRIHRLAHYTDITDASTEAGSVASLATIQDDGILPDDTLTLSAKYKGTYGNGYSISLTRNPLHVSATSSDVAASSSSVNLTTPNKLYVGQVLKFVGKRAEPTNLAEAIARANILKTAYNAHVADDTVHLAADAVNTATEPNASDQTTLEDLLNEIKADYNAHAVSTTFHNEAETALVTAANASDLASAITLINDIEDNFILHCANDTAHEEADTTNTTANTEFHKVLSFNTAIAAGVITNTVTIADTFSNSFESGASVRSMEFDISVFENAVSTTEPVETFTGLSIESDVANYVVDVLADPVLGSSLIEATDEGSGSGIGANTPVTTARTDMTGGTAPDTGLVVTDLIGDADAGTGVQALSAIDDVSMVAFAPVAGKAITYSPSLIQACSALAEEEKRFVFLFEADPSYTATQKVSANTAGGYNARFCAMYTPQLKMIDPLSNVRATRNVSPLGRVCGAASRIDNTVGLGPWQPPAGPQHGTIAGDVLGVSETYSKQQLGALNTAGINVIRPLSRGSVTIMGARSLSSDLTWRYISTGRTFLFIANSLRQDADNFLFMPNASSNWGELTNRARTFLGTLFTAGALRGSNPSQAFYAKYGENAGVQSEADTNLGILRGEVGVAIVKPAEFIVISFNVVDGTIQLSAN